MNSVSFSMPSSRQPMAISKYARNVSPLPGTVKTNCSISAINCASEIVPLFQRCMQKLH